MRPRRVHVRGDAVGRASYYAVLAHLALQKESLYKRGTVVSGARTKLTVLRVLTDSAQIYEPSACKSAFRLTICTPEHRDSLRRAIASGASHTVCNRRRDKFHSLHSPT